MAKNKGFRGKSSLATRDIQDKMFPKKQPHKTRVFLLKLNRNPHSYNRYKNRDQNIPYSLRNPT